MLLHCSLACSVSHANLADVVIGSGNSFQPYNGTVMTKSTDIRTLKGLDRPTRFTIPGTKGLNRPGFRGGQLV